MFQVQMEMVFDNLVNESCDLKSDLLKSILFMSMVRRQ
jgi:hypothetical protein